MFAKKHGGDFLLRIEDTDQTRYVEGAEQYIVDALNWCNIKVDEGIGAVGGKGPYRQSERKDVPSVCRSAHRLGGHAYALIPQKS